MLALIGFASHVQHCLTLSIRTLSGVYSSIYPWRFGLLDPGVVNSKNSAHGPWFCIHVPMRTLIKGS